MTTPECARADHFKQAVSPRGPLRVPQVPETRGRRDLRGQRGLMGMLTLIVIVAVLVSPTWAEEGKNDPGTRLRAQLDASVAWNELIGEEESGLPFVANSVHRWTNNERDPNGQGLMVVWSDRGRPAAVASLYPWNGRLIHELEIVGRNPLRLLRDGEVVWQPQSGLSYRRFANAPVPDKKPAGRIRQMKELADRFSVTMLGWREDNADREVLRRLPKELFRFKPEQSDVLDGAIFAFVKGTDPEAVLILEAVTAGGAGSDAAFEYAFVRATSGGLSASLDDEVVWHVAKHTARRDPSGQSFSLAGPLDESRGP